MSGVSSLSPTVSLCNGLSLPRVGLGTWRSPAGEVEAAVLEAIKAGYRHIDCARLYGNEAEVGRGLARALKEGLVRREDVFVVSKVWNNAHSREQMNASLQATLKDLQLDYIDLLLIHWPVNFKYVEGNLFPRNEAGHVINEEDESIASVKICWQAMEENVDKGLCKSIGVSNFNQEELTDLLSYARIKPVANQVEIQPYFPNDDLVEFCRSKQIVCPAYCPLGNLKNQGEEDVTPLNEPIVAELAKKHSKSPAQIILRWGLQKHGVVLPKSTNPSRIAENLALFDFALSDEDMSRMAELGKKNRRFINPAVRPNGQKVFPQ